MMDSGGTRLHDRARWYPYLIFLGWTLFSVYLYSKYSTLGDSRTYLAGAYDEDTHAARTVVITRIAEAVFTLVRTELLAHLVFSMFAATGVVYLIRQARLHGHYRWPVLAVLLIPNFGVWSSVIGRESLFVGLSALFMGAVLAYCRRPAFRYVLVSLLCIGGMTFIRSPYGIGMALFLLMFLIYRSGPRLRLSMGVQAIFFLAIAALVLMVVWPYIDRYITDEVLPKARGYFTVKSETTRTWVNIATARELLGSLWWSLPLALVGPTPAEVMARPLMLPFFLSGLVVLGSLLYALGVAIRAPAGRDRKILMLGWLPAMIVILIAYVPFGVYNSGSAIRYASCFLLFLTFPSLLLSATAADKRLEEQAAEPEPGVGARQWHSA